MPTRLAATAFLVLSLAACGGSSTPASPSCPLPSSLGSLGTLTDVTTALGAGDYGFEHPFNADVRPDLLSVNLYTGFGVFAAGVAPGTYAIDATEADFVTCGLCALIAVDLDLGTGQTSATYMATGGTVTISQIDTRFVASLTGVTFRQVNINPSTGATTPVGTCSTGITSAAIDSAVQ